jgi:putative GTP pyrophosphokinase
VQEQMSDILEDYKRVKSTYDEYTLKINELISTLLDESKIKVHSVNGRAKGVENLKEKLWRKGNSYNKLSDITDLSGIRIICYFSSQVDDVAKVIEQNFTIIPESSIDKRKLLDPDRFGYLSLHYVVKLSDNRKDLLEYRKYQNIFCEVQIRSILQHSWAEIEHDLGYKSSFEIPRDIKRRFYRLSGLLELADDEFTSLKAEIEEYEKSLKNQPIVQNTEIYIDLISLNEYVSTSKNIKELDESLAHLYSKELSDQPPNPNDFEKLSYFNINKIHELDKILQENKDEILFFANEWAKRGRKSNFVNAAPYRRGVSIFFMAYVLIGKTMDIDKILDYIKECGIYESNIKLLAQDILNVSRKYAEIHNE